MKLILGVVIAAMALVGCASSKLTVEDRLQLYRQHAGEPVKDFHYSGRLDGWTELGASALAVWERPTQAYLLELDGPCTDLEYAAAISISHWMGRVSARFDHVIVRGAPTGLRLPCRIQTIRPLDTRALKNAERQLREVKALQRAQQVS